MRISTCMTCWLHLSVDGAVVQSIEYGRIEYLLIPLMGKFETSSRREIEGANTRRRGAEEEAEEAEPAGSSAS